MWKASNIAGFTVCEFWYFMILVESLPFYTTLDLQLSFYCLFVKRVELAALYRQCVHITSALLAGAHSYFVVWSFKCEWKNSCHDLMTNPHSNMECLSVIFVLNSSLLRALFRVGLLSVACFRHDRVQVLVQEINIWLWNVGIQWSHQ